MKVKRISITFSATDENGFRISKDWHSSEVGLDIMQIAIKELQEIANKTILLSEGEDE